MAFSQWTTKTSKSGVAVNHPVTFTIDGMGYAFTGFNTSLSRIYNAGYQYNPTTNSWSFLRNFPGGARGFAVGASHNGKGYLGFGRDVPGYLNDLWEYDPVNDSWRQLASCPCLGRRHPAFAITSDGKIYVGLGDGLNQSGQFVAGFGDWWEYEISTDTWTQRAAFPGLGRHHPYFFALGTDVYAGFGDNHTFIFDDFYKYNSTNDTWTTLARFPGESRVAGAQFTYNGYGYIVDGEGSDHQNLDDGELYKYDPNNDTWEELAFHSGDGLWAPGAFVIDSMVYVTGGDLHNDASLNTLWAYSLVEQDQRVDSALTLDEGTIFLDSSNFFDENASYQWVDCNNNFEPLAGETNATIAIPKNKTYALIITYSEGGKDTSGCYTYDPVSIAENQLNDDLSVAVYPNPVKNTLNIGEISNANKRYEYSITNVFGMKVMEGEIQGNIINTIDVDNLSNGIYLLNLRSNNKIIKTVKIEKVD